MVVHIKGIAGLHVYILSSCIKKNKKVNDKQKKKIYG